MIFLEEEQLASSVAAVIKLHECLLSRASKVLEAKLAYLDNSREVDELKAAAGQDPGAHCILAVARAG